MDKVKASVIWIIEDDVSTQRMIAAHLKHAAFEPVILESAEKAYELLVAGKRPDLMLLDMLLPGMSGVELVRLLKLHPEWADIPVVVVSVMSRSDAIASSTDGAEAYWINKPFDAEHLIQTVQKVLMSLPDKEK